MGKKLENVEFRKPGRLFGKPGRLFGKRDRLFGKLGRLFGKPGRLFLPMIMGEIANSKNMVIDHCSEKTRSEALTF